MKIDVSSFVQSKVIAKAIGEEGGGGVKVDSLTIDTMPKKTSYYIGEKLDLDGLVVVAEIGSLTGDVTKDCSFTPAEGSTITSDLSTVKVKYGNLTTEIELSLRLPTSLSVSTAPTKTSYLVGDTLDLTGIQVDATYTELRGVADVTEYCTFTPANGSTLDSSSIDSVIASFCGLTATTPISVYNIESIAVTTQPTKTTYEPGQTFNYSGLVVTGYANSGAITKNVTADCTFNPANGSTVSGEDGTYQTTVTYNGLTTTFNYVISSEPVWDARGLEYNSWSTIQYYISHGKYSGKIAVGDTKTVTIGGTSYTMRVVNINTGTGSAATYYPANTMEFVADNGFNRAIGHTTARPYAWRNTNIRSYLNGDFYNSMPKELKDVIIEKTHVRPNADGTFQTDTDKVWLFTAYELGFTYYDNNSSNKTKERDSDNIMFSYYNKDRRNSMFNSRKTWTSSKYVASSNDGFFERDTSTADYISANNDYETWRCYPGFRIG